MLSLLSHTAQRVRQAHGLKKAKTFVTNYVQRLPYSAKWLSYVHDLYRFHSAEEPPLKLFGLTL